MVESYFDGKLFQNKVWVGTVEGENFFFRFQLHVIIFAFWMQNLIHRSSSLFYWASSSQQVLLERTILWRAWWFQAFFIFQSCSTRVASSSWQRTRHNSLPWLADSFCCMTFWPHVSFGTWFNVLLHWSVSYYFFRHHFIGTCMFQKV